VCADENRCVNETDLLALLQTVVSADKEGVVVSSNVTKSHWLSDWDINHSVYFIATTLTTIGYSPRAPHCSVMSM